MEKYEEENRTLFHLVFLYIVIRERVPLHDARTRDPPIELPLRILFGGLVHLFQSWGSWPRSRLAISTYLGPLLDYLLCPDDFFDAT